MSVFIKPEFLLFCLPPQKLKALILAKNDSHYSIIFSKVHGILFLSTPHNGFPHARTLKNFLSPMVGTSAKVYSEELGSSSTTIESIKEQFRTICSPWNLISLYETLPTKLGRGAKKLVSMPVESSQGTLPCYSLMIANIFSLSFPVLFRLDRRKRFRGSRLPSGDVRPSRQGSPFNLQIRERQGSVLFDDGKPPPTAHQRFGN